MENMEENTGGGEEEVRKGGCAPVHSQVKKIKQEDEKIKSQTQQPQVFEARPVFRELTRQLSRSPLGRVGRAISVTD
ncbi:hypothetical protein ACMD2_00018 [Ananas comosus]|uniref:Uncharacterized protein n=1 Tax=Ananas comosus TaxID=4615 RepID=A0A199VQ23_ANACO|nr:hypothetical protein ACMD2_00018 [Ananas comosus]